MQKLNLKQYKSKMEYESVLSAAADAIRDAIQKLNNHADGAQRDAVAAQLPLLVEQYNLKVEEAQQFVDSIHEAQEAYMGSRSERWLDSDKGVSYSDWADEWTAELDPLNLMLLDLAEDVEEPDFVAYDTLQELSLNPF